jgi:hypothetical protein
LGTLPVKRKRKVEKPSVFIYLPHYQVLQKKTTAVSDPVATGKVIRWLQPPTHEHYFYITTNGSGWIKRAVDR